MVIRFGMVGSSIRPAPACCVDKDDEDESIRIPKVFQDHLSMSNIYHKQCHISGKEAQKQIVCKKIHRNYSSSGFTTTPRCTFQTRSSCTGRWGTFYQHWPDWQVDMHNRKVIYMCISAAVPCHCLVMQCRQGLSCYCSIFLGTCFIIGIAIVSAGGNTNEAGIGLLLGSILLPLIFVAYLYSKGKSWFDRSSHISSACKYDEGINEEKTILFNVADFHGTR